MEVNRVLPKLLLVMAFITGIERKLGQAYLLLNKLGIAGAGKRTSRSWTHARLIMKSDHTPQRMPVLVLLLIYKI